VAEVNTTFVVIFYVPDLGITIWLLLRRTLVLQQLYSTIVAVAYPE